MKRLTCIDVDNSSDKKLLLFLKPAVETLVGKTKIICKFLSHAHKHLHHGKLKNKLREATNDWLLP